jgi:phenylalanyl-tRNA synthetase beta chain
LPVVKLYTNRLAKLVGAEKARVLKRLPYIGLDIEGEESDSIRVEYSPNRPDFSTDYGIARALKGVLEIELGLPKYPTSSSGITVFVDERLAKVRPFVACVVAKGLRLDDETVRQLISMQEDLHNGLGRRRRVAAIGFHNLDRIEPPIHYEAVPSNFSFVPLGGQDPMPLSKILQGTETGKAYSSILADSRIYPILRDSKKMVLSFPPIINGNETKVSTSTRNLFVDVTSNDKRTGGDVLAIIATALADAGGSLQKVEVKYSPSSGEATPDLSPSSIPLDIPLIRSVTGLSLRRSEIDKCLRRSRLEPRGTKAIYPRYRIDLLHPVDLAEETALGYGIDRIEPEYPPSNQPGRFSREGRRREEIADLMSFSGMVEVMNYELIDEPSLYGNFGRGGEKKVEVRDPRSLEHSVLRDSLLPSLLRVLSRNVKEEYPQRIFEVGRVYRRVKKRAEERWFLAAMIAHSQANYSEAKMYMESFFRTLAVDVDTSPSAHWSFSEGRCASVRAMGHELGYVGEVKPSAIVAFGLGVPVSAFELELTVLPLTPSEQLG